MKCLYTIIFLIINIPWTFSQVNLPDYMGTFINCTHVELSDLYSKHVRPYKFDCPKAQGYVRKDTPVQKVKIGGMCFPKIKIPAFEIQTSPTCNTVGCIEDQKKLSVMIKEKRTDLSKKCSFKIISAELFEFYPIFSDPGPEEKDPFLETMNYNNEADPAYLSRLNGGYNQQESFTPKLEKKDSAPSVIISDDLKQKICLLPSLEALDKEKQEEFLKIILQMYQNPNFSEDKTQRHLFCLLKNHYEKSEDYEKLIDLVAKMKFKQEMCSIK